MAVWLNRTKAVNIKSRTVIETTKISFKTADTLYAVLYGTMLPI